MSDGVALKTIPHPTIGEIRTTKDYPAGTRLLYITEFEMWNGTQWIASSAVPPVWLVEDNPKGR
mgnify:CR=1 FL=1|tara:strand:- start:740 stop:931 length:192 start_codon:yes stop_codon:yes gene_type:complete